MCGFADINLGSQGSPGQIGGATGTGGVRFGTQRAPYLSPTRRGRKQLRTMGTTRRTGFWKAGRGSHAGGVKLCASEGDRFLAQASREKGT